MLGGPFPGAGGAGRGAVKPENSHCYPFGRSVSRFSWHATNGPLVWASPEGARAGGIFRRGCRARQCRPGRYAPAAMQCRAAGRRIGCPHPAATLAIAGRARGRRWLSRGRRPLLGVAASEPDVLLATKLHVPRLQPGFVPRPRLAEALSEGLAYRLILVCAPAGGAARQSCWPTGPGAASGTWPGCRWMLVTTTRCGSGGTWLRRWTGRDRGSPSGAARCWARRRRPCLRGR